MLLCQLGARFTISIFAYNFQNYYYCMCLKSHAFIFIFLLGLDNDYFFSFHGSSLIGLPFPPSFVVYCFYSYDVCSDLVYIDVCSDLVFGDVWSILLPTMRSDIFCSLSLWIVVADGRVLVICHNIFIAGLRG